MKRFSKSHWLPIALIFAISGACTFNAYDYPAPVPTLTYTSPLTATPTFASSSTVTSTPTATYTPSITFTPSVTLTPSKTFTSSKTTTNTFTPSKTATSTRTATFSRTPTNTRTLTLSSVDKTLTLYARRAIGTVIAYNSSATVRHAGYTKTASTYNAAATEQRASFNNTSTALWAMPSGGGSSGSSSGGYRTGARCRDGSRSNATGRGACSWHGGVSCWYYSDGTCR